MSDKYKDTLTIPYDKLTLKLALMSADSKLTKANMIKLRDKIESIVPKGKIDQNDKVAEYNGITVNSLINSPNYLILKKEYTEYVLKKCVSIITEEGFSDKESWGMIALSLGLLEL